MHIIHLHGKDYVAGMQWSDMHTLKPRLRDFEDVAQDLGIRQRNLRGSFLVGLSKTSAVVGFIHDSMALPRKGNLLSLAGTLAAHLGDGIYVASLGEGGALWVLAIVDGMVSPMTDQFVSPEGLEAQIKLVQSLLPGLKVYLEPGISLDIPDGHEWVLSKAISKAKPVPVVVLGKEVIHPLVLVGGVLVLGLAGWGVWTLTEEPPKTGPSQAEIEAQQRAAYVSSIQGYTSNVLPLSGDGFVHTLQSVDHRYPVERYGWAFEGADCNLQGCNIIYITEDQTPRSTELLLNSLGKPMDAASLGEDGKTLRVTEGVDVQGFATLDESAIMNLPEQSAILQMWNRLVEVSTLRLPGVLFERRPYVEDYAMLSAPPPGMPAIVKGVLAVSGKDPADIPWVMEYLKGLAAKPTRLAWSYGLAQTPKAWRMELTYLAKK